jgi:lysophospholipase L1-like esterase
MAGLSISPGYTGETATALHRLARPTGIVMSPLLIVQGKALRKRHPRLPNAPLPWSGRIDGPQPLSLLALGDSTIAGVGVNDAMQGLVAHLARGIYRRTARGITWASYGQRGATVRNVAEEHLPAALEKTSKADIIVLSAGANDAISLRPVSEVEDHMMDTISTLHTHHPHAIFIVSSLPAFHLFEAIPQPLRGIMAGHAQMIERRLRPTVERLPFALMSPPPPDYPKEFFAADRFHPSAKGYSVWAEFALKDAESRGALDHLRSR